jgi:hypothetical protein
MKPNTSTQLRWIIVSALTTKNPATLSDTDKNGYDTFMASMKAHK